MTPSSRPPLAARSISGQSDPDSNTLLAPSRLVRDGRSYSTTTTLSRGQSYATTVQPPGSFSSDLKSTYSRSELSRPDLGTYSNLGDVDEEERASEHRRAEIRDQIDKETKIKIGSENLLEALNTKSAKQSRDQKLRVEAELNSSNKKIQQLNLYLQEEISRSREPPKEAGGRLSHVFRSAPGRSPSRQQDASDEEEELEPEAESPTFVLAEILQALEAQGMQPEYYVERANALVDLFKRHPTLKYDLAWSIFGLRMQSMLLSDSREVAAAGYRLMRYAITDRKSLQTIRGLQTDYIVILSLVKESKASVEREQALKFVRAFLDVKDGVKEIARSVIRILVAIAEHNEDRLRNICIMTLAEILIRDPPLLVASGGIGALTETLGEGNYFAAESIAGAFLYLLDVPQRRRLLKSGHELEAPFASFTDSSASPLHGHEDRLKANAKVIAALLKSWPGLLTLSLNDFLAIKSLVTALYNPTPHVRDILLEILFDVLRIKPPSWSSSFLAGRRLTTYGRVTNLKTDTVPKVATESDDETSRWSLVDHFATLVLSVLIHAGLIPALLYAEEDTTNMTMKRKTSLLLGEVLKMAHETLPASWAAELQVLPDLLRSAAKFGLDERFIATGTIYQVDSVNRTLYRSGPSTMHAKSNPSTDQKPKKTDKLAPQITLQVDESQFRTQMLDTQVLSTVNYTKWNWPLIQIIIDGALLSPKRLDEATRSTKFVKRLLGFYRPFNYRFSEIKNTKPNQRYVRTGCALIRTLLQNPEGVRYLAESKFIRQLAECLSHFDRLSGLTSESPIFSVERINETLTGGYFAMLGALSKDPQGLRILERWRLMNMFYHIIELGDRDDLIMALLSNLDYNLVGHLRVIISKAMTSCFKNIRIFSTRLMRRYATKAIQSPDTPGAGTAEWSIRLLVTQLYDPEIEVCEVAIKILEEACNQTHSLEYVVKCRPALDHLGEIGAPLLLRFLSTSVGYHYLDGLDYISREMDDWFLGRNDSYVAQIEASLACALADVPEKPQQQPLNFDDSPETNDYGLVPPHFYRELTRTEEGCRLLEQKGHFDEFTATIQDFGQEDDDAETILKVKGCLWAVGNVGSMALGAPFLERSDVVKWIVEIAEKSQVMSLKGTAFFVLGLISRSLHGQEILLQYGWDGAVNEMGDALGYCIPADFRKLFSIKPWAAPAPFTRVGAKTPDPKISMTDDNPVNARILKLTTDLGNTVLAKKAASDLHSIKAKKAEGFHSPKLFHKVMSILESHHYHLGVCRFVLELFDRSVLRRIVFEEYTEGEAQEDEEDKEGGEEDDDDDDDDDDDEDSDDSE